MVKERVRSQTSTTKALGSRLTRTQAAFCTGHVWSVLCCRTLDESRRHTHIFSQKGFCSVQGCVFCPPASLLGFFFALSPPRKIACTVVSPESHCLIDFRGSKGITAVSVTSKPLTGVGKVLVWRCCRGYRLTTWTNCARRWRRLFERLETVNTITAVTGNHSQPAYLI